MRDCLGIGINTGAHTTWDEKELTLTWLVGGMLAIAVMTSWEVALTTTGPDAQFALAPQKLQGWTTQKMRIIDSWLWTVPVVHLNVILE
jgi:hypothetical protein